MPQLPLTWINALFEKFEHFYGQDFARKWSVSDIDAMKQEWAEKLWQFDGATLKAAVDHCSENVPKPPSLPEFILICKQQRPHPAHQTLLPNKFEKTEYGMKAMEGIKAMLKNKLVQP